MQYKNFASKAEFARFLEITPQNLSQWLKRNTFDISIVGNKFPEINHIWLLTGEGEMIKDAEKSSLNSNSQNDNDMLQQGLLDAIKRRDRQMDELLEQQKRLISIIETLSGASNQSRVG